MSHSDSVYSTRVSFLHRRKLQSPVLTPKSKFLQKLILLHTIHMLSIRSCVAAHLILVLTDYYFSYFQLKLLLFFFSVFQYIFVIQVQYKTR
ncbi:hypothetical protein CN470_26355 [Bacillus cereus]|nr:hypothetical protein CN470_26355 [Bacillus cereus]PFS89712.1 hypothetical protein COK58_27380 [Bacillus cereus]